MSQRGHQRERQVKAILEAEGWWVARAAGSLGDADLIASKPAWSLKAGVAEVVLVEVKSTAGGPYERFGPGERERLRGAARLAGARALLCWWPSRGPLIRIDESAWPS